MSSRGGGRHFAADKINNQYPKGTSVTGLPGSKAEQSNQGIADMSLGSSQDDGGDWEVVGRKPRNKHGSNFTKSWVPQHPNAKGRGHPGGGQKSGWANNLAGKAPIGGWPAKTTMSAGRGNIWAQTVNKGYDNSYAAPQAVIRPPQEHGWNCHSRARSVPAPTAGDAQGKEDIDDKDCANDAAEDYDDDSDALDDSDEDLSIDNYDSDASQKSHETRKKSKYFKKLFENLDSLTVDEINEPHRQWHCPACQGGPGAIDWYSLQSLITHAKTKRSRRAKHHRELALLLEEELQKRGASAIPASESYGQWKGLKEEKDFHIVWPPMVIIMNTRLGKDDNDKWIGMGNQELLDYFKSYAADRARHSYGPQGHRGISALIFEGSANGYIEAERLHRHFVEQGTDRDAWDRRGNSFHPGGIRQLYGYMATKEDLDYFNQHSQGKSRLKFEMKSYQEMVLKQLRQMVEDNQQLNWFKNRFSKEQSHAKALEETLSIVSEKLRRTTEENRIVRQRTKLLREQIKEEMDSQEKFYQDQIKYIYKARDEKEEKFEKMQQLERAQIKGTIANPSNTDEYKRRAEEISKLIELQDKEMEEFERERDKVIEAHEKKIAEMKRRHWEEEIECENEFNSALDRLMEKYKPRETEAKTDP